MKCPACGQAMQAGAWICPGCDHIVDASFLEDGLALGPDASRAEPTQMVALSELEDSLPEAMILGNVSVADDFEILQSPEDNSSGRTSTFLFYASGASTRIIHPDAIPRIVADNAQSSWSPSESIIRGQLDGKRSVRAILRASGLAPQELVVTLLTLLDKGAVVFGTTSDEPEGQDADARTGPWHLDALAVVEPDAFDEEGEDARTQAILLPPLLEARRPPNPALRDTTQVSAEADGLSAADASSNSGQATTFDSSEDDVSGSSLLPPVTPQPLDANDAAEVTASTDQRDRATAGGARRDPTESPRPPDSTRTSTPAPELDPAFLTEVPGSVVRPLPELSASAVTAQDTSNAGDLEPPDPQPFAMGPMPPRERSAGLAQMLKGQKLFEQALKDKAEGNMQQALMNMKLALTFDPRNLLFASALDELSKHPDARPRAAGAARQRARELYDQATAAETEGDVERALKLLEEAVEHSKQPAFYNRMGVILAMRKHEYARAQALVEKALELDVGNLIYERNLQTIVSLAAAAHFEERESGAKRGGLFGLLGRKPRRRG